MSNKNHNLSFNFMIQKQQRYSTKKLFLKILRYSQGKTCAEVSLKELQVFKHGTLLKRDSYTSAIVTLHTKLLEGVDGSYNAEIDKTA